MLAGVTIPRLYLENVNMRSLRSYRRLDELDDDGSPQVTERCMILCVGDNEIAVSKVPRFSST